MPVPRLAEALTRVYAASIRREARKIPDRQGKAFPTRGAPPVRRPICTPGRECTPRCRACREIDDTPVIVLYLFIVLAWTPSGLSA